MAAFQLYRKTSTFYGDAGQLLPGGYLAFFEAGTVTPKNVYAEKALSTDNGVTVALDASGRPTVAIWGSGAYDVSVYDVDDVKVGEDLQVEIPGGEATALPTLDADKFLTNDGSVMSWADVRVVPDPSGHADQVLSTDGTALTWIAKPANGTAGAAGADPIGEKDIQFGSDSASSSGNKTTTKSVTFPTAYTVAPKVFVQMTGAAPTSSGAMPRHSITAISTTGFTVTFNTTTGGSSADSYAGSDITSAVTFNWAAFGVAV